MYLVSATGGGYRKNIAQHRLPENTPHAYSLLSSQLTSVNGSPFACKSSASSGNSFGPRRNYLTWWDTFNLAMIVLLVSTLAEVLIEHHLYVTNRELSSISMNDAFRVALPVM